ncbi:SHIRT domain-containing protein [Anaerococcus degeneri]|uniref:SHIRT domain-containing protein n=1 Tax=Anaerococcus degeneri TaxID=361500 RepID=A0ABS7Z1Q1_9FIRM|nr:SHIRT domain-containing protein [Anaerococcus degeneri]MBP2016139.1 putative repeat protein (TIGR02543 family) [Anaerococcus degeneri]MCA2096656.1 SHIRT domain-containing protein [Anaerococcus degeneri]
MQKGKTLSFILASLLSLSQIAPCLAISQKAYASTDKVEKEITSNIDHNLEDGNQNQDKIDVDISLKTEYGSQNLYPNGQYTNTIWYFTVHNNSNKDVYLGEILCPANDSNKAPIISKNIYISSFKIKADELYDEKYLKDYKYDIHFKGLSGEYNDKKGIKLTIHKSFIEKDTIEATLKLNKPLRIQPGKSLTIRADTVFFNKDYNNPFNKENWERKDGNDNNCLFNTDHAMSLKANLYYDKDGKELIKKDNIPEGSKLNDQASGNFQLNAKVGDLSFGGTTNEPSEILIKKSDENDYKKVSGKAEAGTDDTVRFVVPVRISNANTAYQDALKKANQKQYLINPSFLIEKEADDDSLDQEFYIRKTHDESLVKLEKSVVSEGDKTYYKLTLPDGVSDFMTDFDFVYDVIFKNPQRTHGLDKKVKLAFDNLGKVINTHDNDLTLELEADYINATKVYQVDFDMANHGEIKSQSVIKGELAKKPNDPQAAGYSFEGWYCESNYENKFKFETPITADTTIYAKWVKEINISYEFVSGSEGQNLPEKIKHMLSELEARKAKEGEKIKAPQKTFDPVGVDDGIWTFAGWDKNQLEVSEDNNKFTGTWTFTKKKEEPSGPKPGEGNEGNTGHKGGEHSDNPNKPDPDKNKDKDKKDDSKDKPSSGDKDKKDSDKKPSLKPEDAPKESVIRVNTDIYRPIPKGYKRIYFDPGKDACLKYNQSFDYGQIIAFDVKETMTFGEAKAEDKGLVIPIAIPKDKSLKFVGWSPKLQANGEFVEGVKYLALYEKIDKAQDNDGKKSDENKATKNEEKQKENPSKDGKDLTKANKNKKLIADGEISKKENVKTQNALPNKAKAVVNKYTSPRTGVAGLGFVSGILALSSAGLYFSKKTKKD